MAARKSHETPADLAQGLRRFQAWRSKRKGKSRIPDPLWKLAVQLAHKHGVCRTASVLRLDYYALKKHLKNSNPEPPAPSAFVELPLSPVAPSTQCVIELNDGAGGASMRVSLQGYQASELAQLGRTLWETERCCKSPRR